MWFILGRRNVLPGVPHPFRQKRNQVSCCPVSPYIKVESFLYWHLHRGLVNFTGQTTVKISALIDFNLSRNLRLKLQTKPAINITTENWSKNVNLVKQPYKIWSLRKRQWNKQKVLYSILKFNLRSIRLKKRVEISSCLSCPGSEV